MKPKFTDDHRYPRGYVSSGKTNVAKTFARVRAALEKEKAQQDTENVTPIRSKHHAKNR